MGGQLGSISSSMTKETEGGHVSPGSGRDWTEFWSNFTLTGKSSFNLQILSSHRRKFPSFSSPRLCLWDTSSENGEYSKLCSKFGQSVREEYLWLRDVTMLHRDTWTGDARIVSRPFRITTYIAMRIVHSLWIVFFETSRC